jgi:hypothetical protein
VSSGLICEVMSAKQAEEVRMVIGDYSYDVTAFKGNYLNVFDGDNKEKAALTLFFCFFFFVFLAKHPGGSVISFYDNMDATDVFRAFHLRSERATKWLDTLPRRPVEKRDPRFVSRLFTFSLFDCLFVFVSFYFCSI